MIVSAILGAAIMIALTPSIEISTGVDALQYHGDVCVYKNNELVSCSDNILLDMGKDAIKDSLAVGGGGAFLNLSLCNATAECDDPVADSTGAYTAYEVCGLEQVEGTYVSLGTGNWSIYYQFTSTCAHTITTNATMLSNSSGTNLSANNFSVVSLENSDQITINWTVWVE